MKFETSKSIVSDLRVCSEERLLVLSEYEVYAAKTLANISS